MARMGNTQPITSVHASYWPDTGTVDYFDTMEDKSDLELHLLAVKTDHYHIARYDDREEEDVAGFTYELYNAEELTVDEYEAMKSNGWRFTGVTAGDLLEAFHKIAGETPPDV